MSRIVNVFGFLFVLLISFTVIAQSKVAIISTVGKSGAEKKLAREIDDNLSLLFSTIRDAEVVGEKDVLARAQSARIERCNADLRCVVDVASGARGVDYIVVPRILIQRGETKVNVSLFDMSKKRLGSKPITAGGNADGEDLASDIIGVVKSLISENISRSSRQSPAAATSKKRWQYTEVKNEITKGFNAYDKGDIDTAADIFDRAANEMICNCSQNDVAKALLNDIDRIRKGLPKADDAMSANDYRTALRVLEEIKKSDENIREQGSKNLVFQRGTVIKIRYLQPNQRDAVEVEKIHRGFKSKIDEARKWRARQLAEIDNWQNNSIKEREKKISDTEAQVKAFEKSQSDADVALRKKIQDMRYQWEKDDSSLETEIVNLESQISQIEQREKGVIKVSNKKREEAKDKELKDHDKAYTEWKTAHQKEKDVYYNNQKEVEKKEGESLTKQVADLEKKKQELEAKNKEVDAEIQKMVEEFDKEERKIMTSNESVKMKNEDEDRKHDVAVEQEYQKKFDELNKDLAKYDSQESDKVKELEKYDREVEEFMVKNANTMGKIQDDIEKKRTQVEKEYEKVKNDAQQKVEKEYETTLNKLIADKSKLEEGVSKHTDETETLKAKKEEEMIKLNEKEIVAADEKLSKNEESMSKIEQEYETKIAQVQEAIAKTIDEEENEKMKKENELRAKGEKFLAEVGSMEEKIALEKNRFDETKGKIEDEYANKTAAVEDKILAQQSKKMEVTENFRASWGDYVSKEVDKLTAEENKLRTQIEDERAKIAEVDGKYEQKKMEELNSLDAKINTIEDTYAKKTAKVDDDVAKEIEAARAGTMKEIEKVAAEGAKTEDAFKKKQSELVAEEQKIAASFDEKIGKLEEKVALIDKNYEQKMAPFSIDSIVDKMNQAIAELDNEKVEEINKQQEILDAIAQSKSTAEQNYEERKVALKDNRVELSKLERDHAAAMRKMGVDESAAQRKIGFTETSFERKISIEKAKYEREITRNKEELQKLERDKNSELISINRELSNVRGQKNAAISAHNKKVASEVAAHSNKMKATDANAKRVAANGQQKEKQIAGSVKARKATVQREKTAEITAINTEKANINKKYQALINKEKGEINTGIVAKQRRIAEIERAVKEWEIKIKKVDPVKLAEAVAPVDQEIANLQKQKANLQVEKNKKLAELTADNKKKLADFATKKNQASGSVKGLDVQIKNEHALIAKKYGDVRNKMKADIVKFQQEKAQKIGALKNENNATLKQKALAEGGFKKALAAEIAKLAGERNRELAKLKAELVKVSRTLAAHEKSHDAFVQKEIAKVDAKYEQMLNELDMKLASENQRLQNENKAFAAKKKQEKAEADRKFKLFLADKGKFKANNDRLIKQAQVDRDKKIAARKTERTKLQQQWDREKAAREAALGRKTAGLKARYEANNKQIDALTGQIENANNVGQRKLEETKSRHFAASKKQETVWQRNAGAKEQWYEKTKQAIVDKYDKMELKEKQDRDAQKKQMIAKRDRLLVEKEKRKEKRQQILDRERVNSEKARAQSDAQLAKIKDEVDKMKSQRAALTEKDKEVAKAKKEEAQKKYNDMINKINAAELKQVQAKFKKEYDEERSREVQATGVTKKIASVIAEAYAKSGLEKLDKNDIALARKDFVDALYADKDNKTAKEGLKAISTKAQAMYWDASGSKDSNKAKAIKILEMLMKSLLPTDEFYLKSMLLLEELK
ncbi:MAG: hypothetical protein ACOX2F_03235 [bacterium]